MKLQKDTEGSKAAANGAERSHGRWYADACGAAFAMELIGERWSVPIIREMMLGPRRFSELRAALPGLSAKVLTERLETLEASGIVKRSWRKPPIAAQVYGLTQWGRALEPVLQELGRWAVRSTLHDPTLPLTPVALMLSMRTMLDPARAKGMDLWIAFDVGEQHFAGRLREGGLAIHPLGEGMASPDLRFAASEAVDFLPVFYGKHSPEEAGGKLVIEGDPALAQRFIDLFSLPPKCTA
ncbi:MAG TPA: winged helix-turn-helix transcriptional regulator [Sphingomicrobium sp.]|nr:winged helix-turn-helix transcriptional regulator [Sphingomicrobium sp.]HKT86655.1 winged helix-turn-helix transcriptional regulator [Novosphingobium sp.]